jgi:hypothetical protein
MCVCVRACMHAHRYINVTVVKIHVSMDMKSGIFFQASEWIFMYSRKRVMKHVYDTEELIENQSHCFYV